jgi:hypothetical protein
VDQSFGVPQSNDLLFAALLDVESNMRSLRSYIDAFQGPGSATQEVGVLPEVITSSIHLFQEDVDMIRDLLPPDASLKLVRQVKWLCDRKKVKNITARLQNRKHDLSLALSLAGR